LPIPELRKQEYNAYLKTLFQEYLFNHSSPDNFNEFQEFEPENRDLEPNFLEFLQKIRSQIPEISLQVFS